MSMQKKPIAKSASKKISKVITQKVLTGTRKKTTPKTTGKAISGSLKKTPAKSPSSRKLLSAAQDIINAVEAGSYIVQEDKFVSVSSLYEKITGYAAAALIDARFLDYVHADDREAVRKKQCQNLKTKSPDPFEYRFMRKDGELIWLLETSGPAIHKKAKALQASVMDVTRLKQTEESLGLREERYSQILQEMDQGYYENDLKGNLTFVNDALVRNLGYPRKELIGINYQHYHDAETALKMRELYADVYKTGKPFINYEGVFVRKNGSKRYAEVSGALLRDDRGKPIGFHGLARDITLRKKEEEAQRRDAERYRVLMEDIEECYFELDLKGRFTFVNDAQCRDLGYTREELIGMEDRRYADESMLKQTHDIFSTLYRTGQSVRFEAECINKNGTHYFSEVYASLMLDSKGKPVGFHGVSRNITERVKAQEAIRASEERHRSILENMTEAYFENDLAGRLTFMNDMACKHLGYAKEELIGQKSSVFQDEATVKRTFQAYHSLYKTGKPVKSLESTFIRKDGSRGVYELSVDLIRDSGGKPAGFTGVSRDITDRKKMEEALKASEEKYRTIIESIEDGYVEVDFAGSWTFVNDVICRHMGYSREEIIGMDFHNLHTEKSAEKSVKAFVKVLQTGRPLKSLEIEGVRKNKTIGNFELSVSLMKNTGGEPVGFRCISRDITERKTMENALRASEERSRTIIMTIPDPYFENDLTGKFTYVNEAFKNLSGYGLDEMSSLDYKVFMDKTIADSVFALYNTVFKTGLPMKNVELQIITKSGERKFVNLSVSLIKNPDGISYGFHGILRDITERKRAEELIRQSEQSLREYSETLELRVRERTADLEKAKFAAEAASRTKSDFMANISHEFQTPLNAVIGFTKVLQDRMFGDLNEKQEEFVHYIADAGTSLSKIITEILDVTHASSKKVKLNLSSVSVVDMLSKATRLLAPQIADKRLALTVDVDLDADVSIKADEQKIQQVLFHVLSNAVKYNADEGSVHIRAIKTSHEISGREGVSIAVTDTGMGIKAEDMPKLFQTFGTLESPYTRTGKGIGMGLSLARQLLELHDGGISVQSEYGSGSCFTIFLPLEQKQTGSTE